MSEVASKVQILWEDKQDFFNLNFRKNENPTSERTSDHYSKTVVLFDHDITIKMLHFYFKIATQSDISSDLYDHTYNM